MPNPVRNLFTHVKLWRIVGFISSVVGLLCYGLGSSFRCLFGEWSTMKIFLYGVVSLSIISVMLFARKWQLSRCFLLKAHVGFVFLMLTTSYSFFSDKATNNGKPDFLSLISTAAFALMSLSLSMQTDIGFEVELLNFYLGIVTVQLMKINLMLTPVGAVFCYLLFILRSIAVPQAEIAGCSLQEHVSIKIDDFTKEGDNYCHKDLYSILAIENQSEDAVTIYPPDLEAKLKDAIAAGFIKECYHIYNSWRKQAMNEMLLEMEVHTLSSEDVHKKPLKYLKQDIERWIQASSHVVKVLIPNERQLCDRVFGFSPFADLSFMEVCQGSMVQLLNFANAVAAISQSPERLFRVHEVFETLNDLKPDLESLFTDSCCEFLKDEAMAIQKRLREAIKGVFMELESLIRQEPEKVAVPGGGLHPTNRYVMNYLRAACRYKNTLEHVFDDEMSSSSPLSAQVVHILELLQSNLKANSKIYKDPVLCSVFIMNNGRYMVHKAKNSEMGKLLGEEWIQKHIEKLRQHLVNYQRSSWDQVLGMLNLDNDQSMAADQSSSAAECLKEKLEMFKLKFQEICEVQSTWVILDDQLREVIRSSLKKILFMAYENFMAKLQDAVGTSEYSEDFGVQDIVALINRLFQGKDEHQKPRNSQPRWTVVLPNAQDFYEWRKHGQNKMPDSTYPRKYYRCIYKNDQGCGARKHVQQIQENPKMYKTTYSGFHTCTMLPKSSLINTTYKT